jgi:hypothetical protein
MADNCLNCRFFVADNDNPSSGFCHRYPPMQLGAHDNAGVAFNSAYLRVRLHHEDWCGEWKTIPGL